MASLMLFLKPSQAQKFGGVENYDDEYHGYDISPRPGVLIQFKISFYNPETIDITRYHISVYDVTRSTRNRIFSGTVPVDRVKMDLDLDFIKKLLINYSQIG